MGVCCFGKPILCNMRTGKQIDSGYGDPDGHDSSSPGYAAIDKCIAEHERQHRGFGDFGNCQSGNNIEPQPWNPALPNYERDLREVQLAADERDCLEKHAPQNDDPSDRRMSELNVFVEKHSKVLSAGCGV